MSNMLSKLKCVKSKKIQKDDIRRAMNNQKVATINFMDRVIPNALVVDVKKSDIRIGNDTDKIKDIAPAFNAGLLNDEDSAKLLEFLAQFSEETINKVILDNTENFKIMKLSEFIELINKKLVDKNNPAADSKEALTYYNSGSIIIKSVVDPVGNIFAIIVDEAYLDYRLLILDAQFNKIDELNATDTNLSDNDDSNEILSIINVEDGIALLMTSNDDKYIVRYDQNFRCISKLVLCSDHDVQFRSLTYHDNYYICVGNIENSNESFVRIYDMGLELLRHIKLSDENKIFVLNTILINNEIIYIGGAVCPVDDMSNIDGFIMTINTSSESVDQFKVDFNEKYSLITDIKFNELTKQLVIAGISSDNDKHFKAITMITNTDLSVVKTRAFVAEDLILSINGNIEADHKLVLLDNGEILNSIHCQSVVDDLQVDNTLLLHQSADLGIIDTKLILNPDGEDIVSYISKDHDDVVITVLECGTNDKEITSSAIMKIHRTKLFSKFFPTLADGNPVPFLEKSQTNCRSFATEDVLISISPV